MVEIGPYIEYCGEAYVQESFVIRCVVLGLLLVALLGVLVYLERKSRRNTFFRPAAGVLDNFCNTL